MRSDQVLKLLPDEGRLKEVAWRRDSFRGNLIQPFNSSEKTIKKTELGL